MRLPTVAPLPPTMPIAKPLIGVNTGILADYVYGKGINYA